MPLSTLGFDSLITRGDDAESDASRWPLPGEVQLSFADLNALPVAPEILSPSERARAARFRFKADQRRFVAGRGFVRMVLSRHLAVAASAVPIIEREGGRPELDLPNCALDFNVSHSGERIVVAVAATKVGVDLELPTHFPDIESVARSFFSTREAEEVLSAGDDVRVRRFYNCWTRKEAFLKGTGRGLTGGGSQSFEVAVTDELDDRRPLTGEGTDGWSLLVPRLDGFVAAVAVRHPHPWLGAIHESVS